jgi:23S rRNA pseudouridine2605 synthase
MPPRHAYWTIIVDDQPTAFRAHDVEELLPTFNRLREKHANAQLKWFERGQLFDTRDAAREQGYGQGERRWEGQRPGKDWRPGGDHRDPRQRFKDAKKAKWDRYKQNLRSRWEEKQTRGEALPPPRPDRGDHTPPHGDPIRPKLKPRRESNARGGPRQDWRDHSHEFRRDDRPRDDRGGFDRDRRDDRDKGDQRERRPWGEKPDRKPWGTKPGRKPWGAKPGRKPWGAKPGGKPWGAKRGGKAFGSKPPGGAFRKKPFGAGPPRGPRKKRRDDEE